MLQGSAERSQQLNEAYAMLTEMSPAELVSYERELRLRGPAGPTLKCAPLHTSGRREGACCVILDGSNLTVGSLAQPRHWERHADPAEV
jgi:hypothetical protein